MAGSDCRLAVWTPSNYKSNSDITFGRVRIEYGEYNYPLGIGSLSGQHAGSYYSIDEDIELIQ